MSKLTVTFEVHNEDLTSERRLQFRQAIIDAMVAYELQVEQAKRGLDGQKFKSHDAVTNAGLIDKMLNDCNR